MAFVLVQHLAPSHPSALAEILSRATTMPVLEVRDEPTVEPNHVYVIPPRPEHHYRPGVVATPAARCTLCEETKLKSLSLCGELISCPFLTFNPPTYPR